MNRRSPNLVSLAEGPEDVVEGADGALGELLAELLLELGEGFAQLSGRDLEIVGEVGVAGEGTGGDVEEAGEAGADRIDLRVIGRERAASCSRRAVGSRRCRG